VARGAELKQKGQYAEAEQEYRAALVLDPQNADLYANLSYVLVQQKKWVDAVSAAGKALRLWSEGINWHTLSSASQALRLRVQRAGEAIVSWFKRIVKMGFGL
jgi:tetratricopeptide (TPR) repeat protein